MKIKLTHENDLVFKASNSSGEEVVLSPSAALGGTGKDFRPMELLLVALASCSSFDVAIILKKKKLVFTNLVITAEGIRREEIPQIFTKIKLHYSVQADIAKEVLEKYIDLALFKYCSVQGMLREEVKISFTSDIIPL